MYAFGWCNLEMDAWINHYPWNVSQNTIIMVLIEGNVIFHPILSGYTCLWAKYKQRYDISKFLKFFANFYFPPQLF